MTHSQLRLKINRHVGSVTQTTKCKGVKNKVQLPGKIIKMKKEDTKEVELLKKKEQYHEKCRQGKESVSSKQWVVLFGFQQRLGAESP